MHQGQWRRVALLRFLIFQFVFHHEPYATKKIRCFFDPPLPFLFHAHKKLFFVSRSQETFFVSRSQETSSILPLPPFPPFFSQLFFFRSVASGIYLALSSQTWPPLRKIFNTNRIAGISPIFLWKEKWGIEIFASLPSFLVLWRGGSGARRRRGRCLRLWFRKTLHHRGE